MVPTLPLASSPVHAPVRSLGPSLDQGIAGWIVDHRSSALTPLAWALTTVGSEVSVGALALLLLAGCWVRGRRQDAVLVALAMGGAAVLTFGLKLAVHRPRPGAALRIPGGAVDHAWSFPSGHTLTTTVLMTLVVLVLGPALARGRRVALVLVCALLALAVGASRLYLGYHWTSDVVGGLLIGLGWTLASARLAPLAVSASCQDEREHSPS